MAQPLVKNSQLKPNQYKMKKILKKLVGSLLLIHMALTINMAVVNAADDVAPTPPGEVKTPIQSLRDVGEGTNLPSFIDSGQHPDAPPDYLQSGVSTVASPILFAIDIFRFVISGLALIYVFIAAAKLIGNPVEDEATKAKSHMLWGVGGLILIQLADVIVKKMFFGEQGEAFEDLATAELYAEETVSQIRGIIGFIQAFVAAVAVFVIVIRGFTLIASVGDEEELKTAKNQVIYGIGGLIIVGISEFVVRAFVFPDNGNALPDAEAGKVLIISITNYFSGFIAIFSFATLFYAGYKYVVSAGNDEETEAVKKTFFGALIGLLLALGAFAGVNTFVTLEARPDAQTPPPAESPSPIE